MANPFEDGPNPFETAPLVTGRDLQPGGANPFLTEMPDNSATQWAGVTSRALLPYATAATAGAAAGAPAGGVGAIPGALAALAALGAVDLGATIYNVGATVAGGKTIPTGSDVIREAYGAAGIGRKPQTKAQAVVSEGLMGGAEALTGAGAARFLAERAAQPVVRSVANKLAEAPGLQAATGAGAAALPEAAYQYGDVTDPAALTALSLAGGFTGEAAGRAGRRAFQSAEDFVAAAKRGATGQTTPSTEDLKGRAKASFAAAEAAGEVMSPVRFGVLQSNLENAAKAAGYRADNPVMGEITSVLNDLAERTGKPSQDMTDIHNVRKLLGDARNSKEKAVRRVAGILTDELDAFVAQRQGGPELLSGIADYAKMSKSQEIERMLERAATFSSVEPADAIRQQFATLARNEGRMRRFTPEERSQIRLIAEGQSLPKTINALAKIAPGISKERAVATLLGGAGAAGAAYYGMDPTTAAALAIGAGATGAAGRAARNALAQRQANALAAAMRRGDVRMTPSEFTMAPRAFAILPQAAGAATEPR